MKILSKAVPSLTYRQLEEELRARGSNIYLIALEKQVEDIYTLVNLQAEINQQYAVGCFLDSRCKRPVLRPRWPNDQAENLTRLEQAGVAMDRGVDKCRRCGAVTHPTRKCDQPKEAPQNQTDQCPLCGGAHRLRFCTEERPKPREQKTCRNWSVLTIVLRIIDVTDMYQWVGRPSGERMCRSKAASHMSELVSIGSGFHEVRR